MKSKVVTLLAAIVILPVLGIGVGYAQPDESITVKIPFDFYAAGQKMPSGTYAVGLNFTANVADLRANDAGSEILLMGTLSDTEDGAQPELVFDHIGNNYFLKDVRSNDVNLRFSVKQFERKMAGSTSPEQVTVAVK
jgi:hypothetical protein